MGHSRHVCHSLESMDFSFSDNLVTFQPGEMMATVEVVIMEDDILEATELFTLNLMVPQATLDQNVGAGMPEEASVSILDNDSASLSVATASSKYLQALTSLSPSGLLVSVTSPSVVKEGNTITVTVVTDGKFTVPLNVTLTLNDGTATGELSLLLSKPLLYNPSFTALCIFLRWS